MKPLATMVAASVASFVTAAALVDRQTRWEVLCGMLGPLLAVSVTWVLVERIYRRRPELLTSLLIKAFVGKMVFFAAYLAVMLKGLSLRPVPFVIGFTGYFIGLYIIEALYMRRLFRRGMNASR